MGLLAPSQWSGTWIDDGTPTPRREEDLYRDDPAPLLRKSDQGRVVNMDTGVASLTQWADPDSPLRDDICPAYQTSKAALNALTLVFAKELSADGIKVNSACPGWVMTDMGQEELPDYGDAARPKTVEEGVDTPVWLATLPDDGPTGGFFSNRQLRDW